MMNKIKVLIIDDSALVRQVLTSIFTSSENIQVVGVARDAIDAREKIKKLNPDVLTLDVEMPKMDGVTFLKNLMRLRPMPVVMISTLTEAGADVTLEALEVGAVDFVSKPRADVKGALHKYSELIIEKVEMASRATVKEYKRSSGALKNTKDTTAYKFNDQVKIIAIGASTGGTEAIKEILQYMPENSPAIVVAQHIPGAFSRSFTERMNGISSMNVCEPKDGQIIESGNVYISPGDRHLQVERRGNSYVCHLDDGSEVNRHKPSVDVLFRSVATSAGQNAMGVILTGMGSDGALGLLEMKESGSYTVSQDEASSIVWGMPGSAVKLGAVKKQLNLDKIGTEIIRFCVDKSLV